MGIDIDILNRFVGFGNPYGKFWFIGLEEADSWGEKPEEDRIKLEKYRGRCFPVPPGEIENDEQAKRSKDKGYTSVYDIMSKLILSATGADATQYKEYRNAKLLQAAGDTFQANLFPLGKKSTYDWPALYKDLTGANTAEEFYHHVKKTRFPMLRKEWRHFKPSVTVCFGDATKNWVLFKELFELTPGPQQENGSWYEVHHDGIILCPFFDNPHMSGERINTIAKQIRSIIAA